MARMGIEHKMSADDTACQRKGLEKCMGLGRELQKRKSWLNEIKEGCPKHMEWHG